MNELDKNRHRKYSVIGYDPGWATKFESIKRALPEVFGGKALRIEHVGSTSIPGMKAKPIIDVLMIVKDVEDLSQETQKMADAGYGWGRDYIAPRTFIFFRVGPDGERLENIHVCEPDAPKVKQFLAMRDYFRAFPEKAKAYSELKEANARKYPDDYPAYRAAKTSFLKEMEKEAYEYIEQK